MPAILATISENVRKYRESKGLTQVELADLADLHRNYILSVEKGERNISILTLDRIAKALNVEIQRLLDETTKQEF